MTDRDRALSRRAVLGLVAAALARRASGGARGAMGAGGKSMIYVGTYTNGGSKGIYRLTFDAATGALSEPELAVGAASPSFLAPHPGGRFLYAVNELGQFGGTASGAVSAFEIGRSDGQLTLLNQQPSGGAYPCHLAVDRQGRHVLAANYGGGSVVVLPIGPDGRLGAATALVQHHGSSVNRQRQEAPHAHSINLDAAGRFAFVADLGLDRVMVYRYDPVRGTLVPNDPPFVATEPGAGPRHLAWHPTGRWAYVIDELDSTVTVFGYDGARGVLTREQVVSTLPPGDRPTSTTAEIVAHPSGRFVYGSNRGHDSIAVFRVDARTGRLTPAAHVPTGGRTPRNFVLDPTGAWLLAANQDSDSVVSFRVDRQTGALQPTGHSARVGAPVCLRFAPAGAPR